MSMKQHYRVRECRLCHKPYQIMGRRGKRSKLWCSQSCRDHYRSLQRKECGIKMKRQLSSVYVPIGLGFSLSYEWVQSPYFHEGVSLVFTNKEKAVVI